MTENQQREFNFLRGKLDLVTKECERLRAENDDLRMMIGYLHVNLEGIDRSTGQLLLNLKEKMTGFVGRRRT